MFISNIVTINTTNKTVRLMLDNGSFISNIVTINTELELLDRVKSPSFISNIVTINTRLLCST